MKVDLQLIINPESREHGLYYDPEQNRNISTNSMLKTFRRCPRQADYKYARRLKPKFIGAPLKRGKWMHSLLESWYKGEDWRAVHAALTLEFSKLFDEEKEKLGDLPRECERLMLGYIWHYKNHEWNVLGVEQTLEAEFPDGSLFRGRYDMLVEDEYGIWLVDHKNMKTLPNFALRTLDTQSLMYVWAAWENGIPVKGFIWNYLRTKPQTIPTMIQDGSRLSKTTMKNCDYPTAARALKKYQEGGLKIAQYRPWLESLKAQRYAHGQPQTSEFFRRDVLERDEATVRRGAMEFFHTSMRMHDYDFSEGARDTVERVIDRSCSYMCSYTDLCQAELNDTNVQLILRKQFDLGDPLDYYDDEPMTEKADD